MASHAVGVERDDSTTGLFSPLLGDGRPLLFAVAGGHLLPALLAAAALLGGLAVGYPGTSP
jgi:hypothetical protein